MVKIKSLEELKVALTEKTKTSVADEDKENKIRIRAYLKWLSQTDGSPVSDEETQRFWLEAEQEIDS